MTRLPALRALRPLVPPEPTYAYTGEYRESVPNLIYLHSRWYDPTIGRFPSPDDRLGRLALPQDQNRHACVLNRPTAFTDPTGHDVDWREVARSTPFAHVMYPRAPDVFTPDRHTFRHVAPSGWSARPRGSLTKGI